MHKKRKSVLLLMTFVLLCGAYSAAAQSNEREMSLVSRGAAEVFRHGASPNLTTSDCKFNRRQFCARQEHPQNSATRAQLQNGGQKGGLHQTALLGTPPDTSQSPNVLILSSALDVKVKLTLLGKSRSTLSPSSFLLDRSGEMG